MLSPILIVLFESEVLGQMINHVIACTKTESRVWDYLSIGEIADLHLGEKIDFNNTSSWGPEYIVNASFIRKLCTEPDLAPKIQPHGIRIRGARIVGNIDLNSLSIPFNIFLNECSIPNALDLRHATVRSLDLSGSQTIGIDADQLTVSGDMRLADGFSTDGSVCLMGAKILGDLVCTRGCFDNQNNQKDIFKKTRCEQCPNSTLTNCGDCRKNTLYAYALVLEKARIDGSLYLCDEFAAWGGVHLGDATIGVNLNCTNGRFNKKPDGEHQGEARNGRRLTCNSESDRHCACAFNGEGLHVKRNILMNGIKVKGETRLTGALIEGDLDSAGGKYNNKGANAICGDRLNVKGNIFFCDGFQAEGIVRLPRAIVGADLSFCESKLNNSPNKHVFYGEGIRVQGSVYLKNIEVNGGYVDLSHSTIGGNFDCTNGIFRNADEYACQSALNIDPLSASKNDPPKAKKKKSIAFSEFESSNQVS